MIQDIGNHNLDITYTTAPPLPSERVYLFRQGQILLGEEGQLPPWSALAGQVGLEPRFLFSLDGERLYLALPRPGEGDGTAPDGYAFRPVRALRDLRPMRWALAGYTAQHLDDWYRKNRFCGRCGTPLEVGREERMLRCPRCGNLIFPRINPAIIVAVRDGERLLMTKYNSKVHKVFHYVLIAGFVEIGETAEQTVAREVMEEAGVRVKNIRYYKSQPWGCAGNLTLGYFADLDGGDSITCDYNELSDARWFQRDQVPCPQDDVSVTSEMIHLFAAGKDPH